MFTYYRFNAVRIFLGAASFASVIFAPWWLVFFCILLLCLRFQAWEVILVGIFMDLYWMPSSIFTSLYALPLATLVAVLLIFGLEPLRRQLLVGPEIV